MTDFTLSQEEISSLKAAHRAAKKKREADRIKTIILLGTGWTIREVTEALLLDDETIRNYLTRYKSGGLKALLDDSNKGYGGKLSRSAIEQLDNHLNTKTYQRIQEIVSYVTKQFKVKYSISGMTDLLHRIGYTYKKSKLVPGKADSKAQEEFVKFYKELKETKGVNDHIYFMDDAHPQHNSVAAYGWIKKGKVKELKSNTGRKRLNINGAINIEKMSPVVGYSNSINAQSTISLLKKIESKHPDAESIYTICDNARYYRSKKVKEYLEISKVKIVFLPPYSPNLNLIERLWKYFRKKVLNNKYHYSDTFFRSFSCNFLNSFIFVFL
ncbi:MAG: IS630 family transposase [Candidatus Scalindua sp.]|nr:IS630 family transposase [Candidatus Scalindua sp.]